MLWTSFEQEHCFPGVLWWWWWWWRCACQSLVSALWPCHATYRLSQWQLDRYMGVGQPCSPCFVPPHGLLHLAWLTYVGLGVPSHSVPRVCFYPTAREWSHQAVCYRPASHWLVFNCWNLSLWRCCPGAFMWQDSPCIMQPACIHCLIINIIIIIIAMLRHHAMNIEEHPTVHVARPVVLECSKTSNALYFLLSGHVYRARVGTCLPVDWSTLSRREPIGCDFPTGCCHHVKSTLPLSVADQLSMNRNQLCHPRRRYIHLSVRRPVSLLRPSTKYTTRQYGSLEGHIYCKMVSDEGRKMFRLHVQKPRTVNLPRKRVIKLINYRYWHSCLI